MDSYRKPIYLRPTDKDGECLKVIAMLHPIFENSPVDLVRLALEYAALKQRTEISRCADIQAQN